MSAAIIGICLAMASAVLLAVDSARQARRARAAATLAHLAATRAENAAQKAAHGREEDE